jgi:hypothetical protein
MYSLISIASRHPTLACGATLELELPASSGSSNQAAETGDQTEANNGSS